MKKTICIIIFVFFYLNIFSQKVKNENLFPITFTLGNDTIVKMYSLKTTINYGQYDDMPADTIRDYYIDLFKYNQLQLIDSMFIVGYTIISFAMSDVCVGYDEEFNDKINYFDTRRLKALRTECKCKHVWIVNLLIENNTTKQRTLYKGFRMY